MSLLSKYWWSHYWFQQILLLQCHNLIFLLKGFHIVCHTIFCCQCQIYLPLRWFLYVYLHWSYTDWFCHRLIFSVLVTVFTLIAWLNHFLKYHHDVKFLHWYPWGNVFVFFIRIIRKLSYFLFFDTCKILEGGPFVMTILDHL